MSETLPRSATAPNKIDVATPTTEQLHIVVNGEAPSPAPETDTREPSRSASMLRRVADFFEHRAINKAHGDALRENQTRIEDAQADAFASYEENITATREMKRKERKEAIDQSIDRARTFATTVGRNALEYTAQAGLVTLGAGIMAGEAVKSGAEKAYQSSKDMADATALRAMYAADTITSTAESAALKAMYATDVIKDKYQDTKTSLAEKFHSLKEAALTRREARRAKWNARKKDAKVKAGEFATATREKAEKVATPFRIGHAALSAATNEFKSTVKTHNEQNQL